MLRELWQRLVRSPSDNQLQRRVDRIESAIVAGLVVAFLVAAPLLCIVAVHVAGAAAVRERRAERAWRPVPAVLAQSAAAGQVGVDGEMDTAWVPAHWVAPDGAVRHGLLAVPLNAKAGQRMTVWVTPAGQLTHQRLTRAQVLQWEAAAAILAPIGLAALLAVAAGVVRVLANRRRMAAWTRAWAATGPRWSSLR
ncbi:MAG TPA: hypothetical protein VMA72_11850 [Streptosporangiaceae bacterium]|nr:hypothetical protein [Streptosporangiaceae bacterium]